MKREYSMKKVILTGATGLIGINLIKYLISEGLYVTAIVRDGKKLEKCGKNHYNRHNLINKTIIRKSGKHLCQSVLISHTSANAKLSTASVNATLR